MLATVETTSVGELRKDCRDRVLAVLSSQRLPNHHDRSTAAEAEDRPVGGVVKIGNIEIQR